MTFFHRTVPHPLFPSFSFLSSTRSSIFFFFSPALSSSTILSYLFSFFFFMSLLFDSPLLETTFAETRVGSRSRPHLDHIRQKSIRIPQRPLYPSYQLFCQFFRPTDEWDFFLKTSFRLFVKIIGSPIPRQREKRVEESKYSEQSIMQK